MREPGRRRGGGKKLEIWVSVVHEHPGRLQAPGRSYEERYWSEIRVDMFWQENGEVYKKLFHVHRSNATMTERVVLDVVVGKENRKSINN